MSQEQKERSGWCPWRQVMWVGPEGAGSYPTGAGEPWKGFTQGGDIVIRSDLGTKQRRNTVEMKQRLKR